MKVLLDTSTFLWLAADDPSLSARAKKIFLDNANDCLLSIVSIWELAIKTSLNKLTLPHSVEKFVLAQLHANDIQQLPIHFRHVARVEALPFHHRDPFDRLIISQAIEEKIPILSPDKHFDVYPVRRLW